MRPCRAGLTATAGLPGLVPQWQVKSNLMLSDSADGSVKQPLVRDTLVWAFGFNMERRWHVHKTLKCLKSIASLGTLRS
jgi:hypothetical protein